MAKRLSEMSLEELWALFPIVLTEHQACWTEWYEEEKRTIGGLLPAEFDFKISHIGSTAIQGIWAKPIIDILIELPDSSKLKAAKETLCANGYLCMSEEKTRASLNKGYTEQGFAERVFHLHLRLWGDHDEIFFRDYLNAHPEAAGEYEKLKLELWKKYEHDRDTYTYLKTELVTKYTALAKKIFAGEEKKKEACGFVQYTL